MYEEVCAYVPRVLLEAPPELRAPLQGNGIQGEVLGWPFGGGCLLQYAVRGMPRDGLHGLALIERTGKTDLPDISAAGGFGYGQFLLDRTPEQLFGCLLQLETGPAEGRFALV